jgi:hypothetical protein
MLSGEASLLRLDFSAYTLFEQLMMDFAASSDVIKHQLQGSRMLSNAQSPEADCYRTFRSGQSA